MTDAAAEIEHLVESYGEVWNEGEYSKIPELVSESYVLHDPAIPEEVGPGPEGEAHGPEGLESFLRWLRSGFPDMEVTINDLLTNETVAMDEVTFTGTNSGELNGLPPTGREVELMLMTKFIIEDGKITEHRAYLDQREFAEQLGLTFPTILAQIPKLAVRKLRMSI
ncbi:MAG: ester cyclase [Halobacteriales archaeon]